MKNPKLTQVNVFLKISEPLYSEIINVSQEIYKDFRTDFSLDFSLGKNRYLPHLTLYLFALPENNLSILLKKAKEIASEMKSTHLEVENVIAAENKFVMLQFKKNNILYQYHLMALNSFNPLREKVQRKKYTMPDAIEKLENKQRKYIKRYGHRFILDQYQSHISLTTIESPQKSQEIAAKYKSRFAGKITKTESLCIMEDDYETGNAKGLIFSQKL